MMTKTIAIPMMMAWPPEADRSMWWKVALQRPSVRPLGFAHERTTVHSLIYSDE